MVMMKMTAFFSLSNIVVNSRRRRGSCGSSACRCYDCYHDHDDAMVKRTMMMIKLIVVKSAKSRYYYAVALKEVEKMWLLPVHDDDHVACMHKAM